MASFVVKAAPQPEGAEQLAFDEKTMWRGRDCAWATRSSFSPPTIRRTMECIARGVVTEVTRGMGNRISIRVRRTGTAKRTLGRDELRAFRELSDGGRRRRSTHKLYRQATNKIAGISDAAAAFLRGFF